MGQLNTGILLATAAMFGTIQPANAQVEDFFRVIAPVVVQSIINEAERKSTTSQPTNGNTRRYTFEDTLSHNDRVALQSRLQALGLYRGALDGDIGPASRRAISAYQQSLGIPQTGTLDAAQFEQLSGVASPGPTNSGPLDMSVAQAGEIAPGAFSIGRLGLPERYGMIYLAPGGLHAVEMDDDDFDDARYRLQLLLALAADFDLLSAPEMTGLFVRLIDVGRLKPYLSPSYYERIVENDYFYVDSEWAGDNQFAQEDSRQRFLADFSEEIRAMVPDFPLAVAEVAPLHFGRYENGAFELEVSDTDHLGSLSWLGFETTEMEVPQTWVLPQEQARSVLELPPAEGTDPYVADRYFLVREMRWSEPELVDGDVHIRVRPFANEIYRDQGLTMKIGSLPTGMEPSPQVQPVEVEATPDQFDVQDDYEAPNHMALLGVSLGMPLEEAKTVFETYFEGRDASVGFKTFDGKADPIMGQYLEFADPPMSDPNYQASEIVKLYFDASAPDRPVIAIGRVINTEEVFIDGERTSYFKGLLAERYGQPQFVPGKIDIYSPIQWSNRPAVATELHAKHDVEDYCGPDSGMAHFYHSDGRFHSDMVPGGCGDLLSVWMLEKAISMTLVDTEAIVRIREDIAARAAEAEAAAIRAAPKVQF